MDIVVVQTFGFGIWEPEIPGQMGFSNNTQIFIWKNWKKIGLGRQKSKGGQRWTNISSQ